MPHFIKIGGTRTGLQYGEMFNSRTFYGQLYKPEKIVALWQANRQIIDVKV